MWMYNGVQLKFEIQHSGTCSAAASPPQFRAADFSYHFRHIELSLLPEKKNLPHLKNVRISISFNFWKGLHKSEIA
jgi:hypothetical protein